MKHILNQLIQLQELNFALSEQKASNPEARLTQLEESIGKLSGEFKSLGLSISATSGATK